MALGTRGIHAVHGLTNDVMKDALALQDRNLSIREEIQPIEGISIYFSVDSCKISLLK